MLLPERMQEVNLFVLAEDLEPVTEALIRLGTLQLQDVQPETWKPPGEWADIASRLQRLGQRLGRLLAALELKPEEAPPPAPLRPEGDLERLEGELTLLEARVEEWQQRLASARQERQQLEVACPQVATLLPLEVPVEQLRDLRHMHLTIGTIPSANLPRVEAALFQIAYVMLPISREKDRTLVFAASAHEDAAILDRALKSAFFESIMLPLEAKGQPRAVLATLSARLEQVSAELTALEEQKHALVRELGQQLQLLWRRVQADVRIAEAIRRFTRHGEVFLIAGWVPQVELDALARAVREAAHDRLVLEALPPGLTRQDVPTLLRMPAWLRPFEGLVAIFGMPGYSELNPTLFAAVAFLLMYGMMFGDLGHGALLALLGLGLLRRSRSAGLIVTAAGVSGMLFGLLYGTALGYGVMHPLWLQPLHDIQTLLLSAVIAGVALLNLGLLLNLVGAWRQRAWWRFWLDKNGVLGLALYWTLLGGGLAVFRGALAPRPWLLLLLVLSLLLWFKEPLAQRLGVGGGEREPLGEMLVTGFFELFEAVIGYASNSLSFVRLGAFAVAHEGLSRVVLGYSSGPGGWLVLLIGTVLIVGFEGLIVGIQTLRLEYYEFFGRFFGGSGRPFVPLSLKGGQG